MSWESQLSRMSGRSYRGQSKVANDLVEGRGPDDFNLSVRSRICLCVGELSTGSRSGPHGSTGDRQPMLDAQTYSTPRRRRL
jgi:hypothetical protein